MSIRSLFSAILLSIVLSSCALGLPASSEPTATPQPTATAIPTIAPTPTMAPPLVILLLPADISEETSREYQKTVYELAQAQNYRFVVLNTLTEADLEPSLKIVIDLNAETDVKNLAAKAPGVQFLAVNLPGIEPAGNLSILGANKIAADQIGFIAGFIAATITEDYRTGILVRKGSENADTLLDSFRTGQHFFCGLCNSYGGPFESYPLLQDIPEDAKPSEYGAYADILLHKQVSTIFIEPGVDIPELLTYLQSVGVLMIGTQTPKNAVNGWIVSLQPNYLEAVKAAFPDLVAGSGGKSFPAPLTFNDANPDLFTPGKQLLARSLIERVLAGQIATTSGK